MHNDMKPLEYLDLDDSDVERIEQIIEKRTGKTLADEAYHPRRRYGVWVAVALAVFLLAGAGVLLQKLYG